MPVASTVKRLPQPVRDEIHSLLDNGRTLDEIIAHLRALGVDEVSRSALGRYAKNFNAVVERVRRSREIADALVRNFGQEDESKAARANIEMMHAVVSHMLLQIGEDDGTEGQGVTLDARQTQALSSALANLARAKRLDQDAILKAREEADREAEARMSQAAEAVARESSGPMTAAQMKERMLAVYRGDA